MAAVLPFRFLLIASLIQSLRAWQGAYHLPLSYSSGVVTAAMALFTNSSLILSGGMRSCTTSSLTETMTPRMPPLVVTLSPFFNWLSICCHFFCFFWLGAIIRKYSSAKNTSGRSSCVELPSEPIQFPSFLLPLLHRPTVARRSSPEHTPM